MGTAGRNRGSGGRIPDGQRRRLQFDLAGALLGPVGFRARPARKGPFRRAPGHFVGSRRGYVGPRDTALTGARQCPRRNPWSGRDARIGPTRRSAGCGGGGAHRRLSPDLLPGLQLHQRGPGVLVLLRAGAGVAAQSGAGDGWQRVVRDAGLSDPPVSGQWLARAGWGCVRRRAAARARQHSSALAGHGCAARHRVGSFGRRTALDVALSDAQHS